MCKIRKDNWNVNFINIATYIDSLYCHKCATIKRFFSLRIYYLRAKWKEPLSNLPISVWRSRYKEISKPGLVSLVFVGRDSMTKTELKFRIKLEWTQRFLIVNPIPLNCRICGNTWLPFSRGAEKRAIRKSCRHMGVWCNSVYTSCRLSTFLGRRSTSAVCANKSRSLWCKIF